METAMGEGGEMTRRVRVVAYTAGFLLLGASAVLASADVPTTPEAVQIDLVKWGLTQGGLVVVTLVILWSYRRDFRTLLAAQQSELGVLTGLVEKSTHAMTDAAAATREQTASIERMQARI